MDRFIVVSYRSDGADYCRGCLMDSSSSDFDYYATTSLTQAIDRMTDGKFKALLEEAQLKYGTRETEVSVNGITSDSYPETEEEDDDPVFKHAIETIRHIRTESETRAKALLLAYKVEVAAKCAAEQTAQEAAKKAGELKLLNDLKQKYEGDKT